MLSRRLKSPTPWRWIRAQVQDRIASHTFSLTLAGFPVPWTTFDGDQVVFYNHRETGNWDRGNIYRLTPGSGQRASTISSPVVRAATGQFVYTSEVFEKNVFAATAAVRNPADDFWFWMPVAGDHPAAGIRNIEFTLDDLASFVGSGVDARVTLEIYAATQSRGPVDHHLSLAINGYYAGAFDLDGRGEHSATVAFPAELLGQSNTLTITASNPEGVGQSIFYVNRFSVHYPRNTVADSQSLGFLSSGSENVALDGFTDQDVRAFRVSDAFDLKQTSGIGVEPSADGGYRASFTTPQPGHYVVVSKMGLKRATVSAVNGENLHSISQGADYIVIAPAGFEDAARRLVEYRQRRGRTAKLVALQDVFDSFSHSSRNPWAIQAFLLHAYRNWQLRPELVALVGKGSFDYKDYKGLDSNLMPPILKATAGGIFASDGSLGDLVGSDEVPEVLVGRIPVLSEAELDRYIDKVRSHEASASDPTTSTAIFMADDRDAAGTFSEESDRIISNSSTGLENERIYLDDLPLQEARGRVFSALGSGAEWLNYVGHGGVDRMASEKLLGTSDVAALPAVGRYPILTGLSCTVARFEVPGLTSVGEALVLAPGAGVIAAWAPSGLSYDTVAAPIGATVGRHLFSGRHDTLGEALAASFEELTTVLDDPDSLQVFNLLGDPALLLGSGVREPAALFEDGFETATTDRWSGTR